MSKIPDFDCTPILGFVISALGFGYLLDQIDMIAAFVPLNDLGDLFKKANRFGLELTVEFSSLIKQTK